MSGRVVRGLAIATAAATAARLGLAVRQLVRDRRTAPDPDPDDEARVLVLQPILGGDPTLERHLRENLAHHPRARFRWLVDEDDPVGCAAARNAERAAGGDAETVVRLFPPPPPGRNPKVVKLAAALVREDAEGAATTEVDVPYVAVLDDDTVLPPGTLAAAVARLRRADLVTGLPRYRREGSLWSRLIAAFVDGNALITYLPVLAFQPPVTVNGMFTVMRRETLRELGGFEAIETGLCDDVELALLFRRAGLRLEQTTLPVVLATTVPDATTWMRLMRRWMVFARHLLLEELSPATLGLVVVPGFLPPLLACSAAVESVRRRSPGPLVLAGAVLGAKVVALALVRRRFLGTEERVSDAALEIVADLLQPLHVVTASIRPHRLRWRTRELETVGRTLRGPDDVAGGVTIRPTRAHDAIHRDPRPAGDLPDAGG